MKDNKASSLLIGNRNNSNSKNARSVLIGRKQNASSLLIGRLNDSDSDGVPDRFDCRPNNYSQQGIIDKVKSVIKKIIPGGNNGSGGGGSGGRSGSVPQSPIGGGSSGGRTGSTSTPTTPTSSGSSSSGSTITSGSVGRSGGGSSGGSSNQGLQSTMQNVTPTATTNQNAVSVIAQSSKPSLTPQQKAQQSFQAQQQQSINILQQEKQVKTFIESEKAKDILLQREQARRNAQLLNLQNNQENVFEKKYYDNVQSRIKSVNTPELKEVSNLGDQRGTAATIFSVGDKPKLSGSEVIYATEKVIGDKYERSYQRDFNEAIKQKTLEESNNINIANYQNRIAAGEDYDTVAAEYEQEVEKANKRIQEYADSFYNNWYERRGKNIERAGANVVDSTSVIFKAKDTQAKVGSYIIKGALFGGVTTAGGLAVGAAGATAATVVGVGGLIIGGASAAYYFGKAGYTGYKQYGKSKDLGVSSGDAFKRALVGGATDIAPAAYGALGATVGGLAVYGSAIGTRNLIKTGNLRGVTPKEKTFFIAEETPKKGYSDVSVISKTSVGKTDTFGLAQQRVVTSGSKSSGVAKGFIVRGSDVSINALRQGKIKPFISAGKSQQVGEGVYFKNIQNIKIGRSIGQGIQSKSISQIKGEGVNRQKVIGAIEQIGESDTLSFIGGSPSKTRIYKSGRVTEIAEPTIRGIITRTPIDTSTKIFFKPSPSGLKPQVQKSIISQVSALSSASKTTPTSLNNVVTPKGYGNSILIGMSGGNVNRADISISRARSDFLSGFKEYSKSQAQAKNTQINIEPSLKVSQPSINIQKISANVETIKPKQSVNPLISDLLNNRPNQKSSSRTSTPQKESLIESPIFKQPQSQVPATKQKSNQLSQQKIIQSQIFQRGFAPGEIIRPRPERPKPFGVDLPKKKERTGQKAFSTFVLIDSTKPTSRWIKVAEKVPYEAALGFGAKFVSQDISAQFKVEEDKGEEARAVSNPFWKQLGSTFRNFMVRKGTKIENQNRFIQKAGFRLSSAREKQQIQSARSLMMGGR